MFKELFTTKKEIEKSSADVITKTEKSPLKFREILCPKTCQALSSKECATCPHKKEYRRAHALGLSMVTMICVFGAKNDEKE